MHSKGGMCGEEGCASQRGPCVVKGTCMAKEGACVVKGGMHSEGGVCAKGVYPWQRMAYLAKEGHACWSWHAWPGGMCSRRDSHCSGRYTSYWNAFCFSYFYKVISNSINRKTQWAGKLVTLFFFRQKYQLSK